MKVSLHIFRNKLKFYDHQLKDENFYEYDDLTKSYYPKEEHLKTSFEILDDEFNDYSDIIKYDISPETFDANSFVQRNMKAFKTMLEFGSNALRINLDSQYNVDQVVGIVVVLEDKIPIDITGQYCIRMNSMINIRTLIFFGAFGSRKCCICTKKKHETYRAYVTRCAHLIRK